MEETGGAVGRLSGKTAVISGAGQPFGAACAEVLAGEGATVIGAGGDVAHDVADDASWRRVIDAALSDHGQLDILVNAAQAFLDKPLVDTTLAELRHIEETNLLGAWLGVKHGILAMRKSGGGSIVTVSSNSAKAGHVGAAAVCAAAGGVRIMTQAAALECGARSDNIRVNTVLTGSPDTHADDVARAVLHVVSGEASFMTGSDIVVGGA